MTAKLYLEVSLPTRTGVEMSSPFRLAAASPASHIAMEKLAALVSAMSAGTAPGVVRLRMDDSVGVSSTQTIAPIFANLAAGDKITIVDPTSRAITYTGQLAAVTLGDPTFRINTDNATTGTSLAAQINADPRARGWLTAAGTTTVTVTITQANSAGNKWGLVNGAVNPAGFTLGGALFTGGHDGGSLVSCTLALSGALTANDTITIGGVTLTAKVAPAGQNQFAATVSAAADGAALTAAINAHTDLKGIFLASGAATVTVTLQEGGRSGKHVLVSKVAAAITQTGTSFAPLTTDTWASNVVTYNMGAVAL